MNGGADGELGEGGEEEEEEEGNEAEFSAMRELNIIPASPESCTSHLHSLVISALTSRHFYFFDL